MAQSWTLTHSFIRSIDLINFALTKNNSCYLKANFIFEILSPQQIFIFSRVRSGSNRRAEEWISIAREVFIIFKMLFSVTSPPTKENIPNFSYKLVKSKSTTVLFEKQTSKIKKYNSPFWKTALNSCKLKQIIDNKN